MSSVHQYLLNILAAVPNTWRPVIFCLHSGYALSLGDKFVRNSEDDAVFADRPVKTVEAHF